VGWRSEREGATDVGEPLCRLPAGGFAGCGVDEGIAEGGGLPVEAPQVPLALLLLIGLLTLVGVLHPESHHPVD